MKELWILLLASSTIHISALSDPNDLTGIATHLCKNMEHAQQLFTTIQQGFMSHLDQDKSGPTLTSKVDCDGATIQIKPVSSSTIEAHTDKNSLTLEHSDFTAHFIQDSRLAQLIATIETTSQENSSDENQDGHVVCNTSRSKTISLKHKINFEETKIVYDETTKELSITFIGTLGKQVPIIIKKAESIQPD